MKVAKPVKVPILTRIVEWQRVPQLHVAAMLGFPLSTPRALIDEITFWPIVMAGLGEKGVLDDGVSKVRGELLVCGAFHAPGGVPLPASYVRASCAGIDKRVSVIGDRLWKDGVPTAPTPITTMPIDWAHAFGGEGFAPNPYGKGAAVVDIDDKKVRPLPNVELYDKLIRKPSDKPEPAGLMAMDVTFAQRRKRAGSYDRGWFEEHYPGMPPDMDPTFFNTAPSDQWLDGHFVGDEALVVENMHPEKSRIEGRLPGLVTRAFVTQMRSGGPCFIEIDMRCDTVWLFPEAELGVVIFHGSTPVADDDAGDIAHLVVACEDPATPRSSDHYRRSLARRLDKDEGALASLTDADLMPPLESGVAPNVGQLDVGRWTKSEGLHAANLRRGAERELGRRRARAEELGFEAALIDLELPPPEPEPPLDDLDALATYCQDLDERAKEEQRKIDAQREEGEERARQLFEEMGGDFDAARADAERGMAGPPTFSAAAHLQMALDLVDILRDGGSPDLDLEARVADPGYQAELIETEERLRELYRQYAHLQSAPAPAGEDASARARALVQAAIDSQTSLAGRDLTGADLSGMSLAGIDLSGAFLEGCKLSSCDLREANLEQAVLTRADLTAANLAGASLGGCNLGRAILAGASFDRCDMSEAVLSHAELAGAKLTHADLTGADLLEAVFGDVDLSGAKLRGCTLIKADLSGARLVAADLGEATFIECRLDGGDLSQADLHKATFVACKGDAVSFRGAVLSHGVMVHGSSFPGADFRDADLERSNFRGTSLEAARLDRARLIDSDLSECNLRGGSLERADMQRALLIRTDLDGASLRGSNLKDALMSKATLCGTDFAGANLHGADLSRVRGDRHTSMTDAEVGMVRFLPKASDRPLPEPVRQGGGEA